ncbi:hypothetical protein [Rhodococcus phenolicus]|uniref:hypothetical protein n=1 Tax=Rhodococcus phenolicus TaxID=263849 RepID=UPI00082A68F9|nr:hypothetical protein [Rhodococcus phenolicus]
MPPQRRNPGTGGARRRPKIAGTGRGQGTGGARPASPPPDAAAPEPEALEQTAAVATPGDTGVELSKKSEPAAGTSPEPPGTEPTETAEPAAPEAAAGEPPAGEAAAPGPAAQRTTRPLVLLGAAAVALGAFAVVAAFQPGAKVENRAWVDTAATDEVQRAATRAIETMHGYNYETIDDNFAAIRDLLTPQMQEEFDRTAEVTKEAAVQTHTVTEVAVTQIGTSMLDDSRAEVSAYINVSATGDGIAQGSAAAPLLVRMEKVDGRWLVSELTDS